MGQLDGEVAIVTGGGSGIGRGVVDRYIEEGARVAVVDLVQDRLDDVVLQHGDRALGILGDVTKMEDNQRAVRETVDAFGKLDTFVANAGLNIKDDPGGLPFRVARPLINNAAQQFPGFPHKRRGFRENLNVDAIGHGSTSLNGSRVS